MKSRAIIHFDLDAFFASVEVLENPDLAGKPMVVAGAPEYRGVVSSASYEARAFGIRSAMPTQKALRLCPQLIVVTPKHHRYGVYSERIMDIARGITPLVEQLSIDEAFLDVTGCEMLWGQPRDIAAMLQRRILEEVGLSASIGLASNKLVAKIASDLQKPHGFVVVPFGEEAAFLATMPIEKLWGVGPRTAEALHKLGIKTIGDLTGYPAARLTKKFGEYGLTLQQHARGIDDSPVAVERQAKSLSAETTFARDIDAADELRLTLLALSERVGYRLRSEGYTARTVTLKLRLADFSTITRSRSLPLPTSQDNDIFKTSEDLFFANWKKNQPVRLLGIGASNLLAGQGQLHLFGKGEEKKRGLDTALDSIRRKYGRRAIRRASLIREDQEAEED